MTGEDMEEVRRVLEALAAIEAMEDPVAQARAASEVLKASPERNKKLKELRDKRVKEMRAEGLSLRKIAAAVGVSLGTVQDIMRGHSGTWASRAKADPSAEEPPATGA